MDRAGKPLLVACNFSGEHRRDYRVGLPFGSTWLVDFNTDSWGFGGGGRGDSNPIKTEPTPALGQPHSLTLDLPPMSCVIYRCVCRYPQKSPDTPAQGQQPSVKIQSNLIS
jgi:1,4-alpha-glucan branching enzyme